MITHLLNRTLEVHREQSTPDGVGGRSLTYAHIGDVAARVSRPSAAERQVADQEGAEITADVYLEVDADVRRGDRLVDGTEVLEVLAVTVPSKAAYLKADCRRDVPAAALPAAES